MGVGALVRWCVGALGRWGVVTEARPYGGTNLEPVLLPIFLLSSSISSIYGGGRPNSILLPSIHIAEWTTYNIDKADFISLIQKARRNSRFLIVYRTSSFVGILF